METLYFSNNTYSMASESQCSERSDASTTGNSDNVQSLEGLIESSVDSEDYTPRCSDNSDSEAERNQGNENFLRFSHNYMPGLNDYDLIARNLDEMSYSHLPPIDGINMDEVRQIAALNDCDNNIIDFSMDQVPLQAQNIEIDQELNYQYCDNRNLNFLANASNDLFNINMQSHQLSPLCYENRDDSVTMAELNNEANTNSTVISVNVPEGQNNAKFGSLQEFLGVADEVTNVRRKVDKQPNSSCVSIHIEKFLPAFGAQVAATIGDQGCENLNIDPSNLKNFDIIDFISDVGDDLKIEDTTICDDTAGTIIKQEPLSCDVLTNHPDIQVVQHFVKQEIVPEEEVKVETKFEPWIESNEFHPSQLIIKQEVETSSNNCSSQSIIKHKVDKSRNNESIIKHKDEISRDVGSSQPPIIKREVEISRNNNKKPHVPSVPKVAGRKRIDMVAQRYIIDDDEENIDVETVTKEDNPMIEAENVDSLFAQFEASQIKESKKDKVKSSKQKVSSIKNGDSNGKKVKNNLKKEKKLKTAVNKHLENTREKEKSHKRSRDEDSIVQTVNYQNHKNKNSDRRDDERKSSIKREDVKSKEKRPSSKSSSPLNSSRSTKPDEKKKDNLQRRSDPSKSTTRSDPKSKTSEKHGSTKNKQEIHQKTTEQAKTSKPNLSSTEKTAEVPKDLIGRIKEAPKPRQIKLLDTCPFLVDPIIDRRKKKPRTTTNKSSGASAKPVVNGVPTSTLATSTHSIGSRPVSTNSFNPKPLNNSSTPSRNGTSSTDTRPTTSVANSAIRSSAMNKSGPAGAKPVLNGVPISTLATSKMATNSTGSRPETNSFNPKPSNNFSTSSSNAKSSINTTTTTSSAQTTPLVSSTGWFKPSSLAKFRPSNNHADMLKRASQVQPKPLNNSMGAFKPAVSSGNVSNNVFPQRSSGISLLKCNRLNGTSMQTMSVKTNPQDMSRPSKDAISRSDASTGTCSRMSEIDDHKINSVESSISKCKQENVSEQTNEQNVTSNQPKRRIINWEDYKKNLKRVQSKCTTPRSEIDLKIVDTKDWFKKADVTPQESINKTEQPAPPQEIPPSPPRVPGLERQETYDVSVNACVVEEAGLNQMETLEEIKPLLQKSNVKIDQNSLISCLTNPVQNKVSAVNDTRQEEEVIRFEKVIRYLREDRVKPEVCSVGVQTNISLIDKKPPVMSITISSSSDSSSESSSESSSSDDDSSYTSHDSRYSRSSKKRSRKSRTSGSSYSSRGSTSRSSSPLVNPSNKCPSSFRSTEERKEFKRDAELRHILFLDGVEDYIDEKFLYKTFKRYGEIKSIKIYNRRNGRKRKASNCESESYAFVTFTDSKGTCAALKYYKMDYPKGENFFMCFGGRREFCKEKYSDLDNMPSNYQYEAPRYERKTDLSFDDMLREYKKTRRQPTT